MRSTHLTNKFVHAFLIATFCAAVAGCGAPKPPMPYGEKIAINPTPAQTEQNKDQAVEEKK